MYKMRLATLALLGALGSGVCLAAQQPAVPSAQAQAALPTDAEILAIIKQRVDDKRSAGMVVGVIDPDGRQRVVAYGEPGPGQPPLDGNTVFEIGSISKVFTSTVLAQLVQEGKVHLEDPAQKYLPPTVHLPTRNGKEITLGNLAMQNSGLPRMPSNFHP
ncbi:MAG: serine hydrolase, partial [Gemmatimonadaceae bacterium]